MEEFAPILLLIEDLGLRRVLLILPHELTKQRILRCYQVAKCLEHRFLPCIRDRSLLTALRGNPANRHRRWGRLYGSHRQKEE